MDVGSRKSGRWLLAKLIVHLTHISPPLRPG